MATGIFRFVFLTPLLIPLVWLVMPVQAGRQVSLQPLAQQVRDIEDALNFLGQPLPGEAHREINKAVGMDNERQAISRLQEILDSYVLAVVDINPESRVKVRQGAAKAVLVERGTRLFLVKVLNQAGVTAPLLVESQNSGPKSVKSDNPGNSRMFRGIFAEDKRITAPALQLTPQEAKERWAEFVIYRKPPMTARLSGLGLEYQILQVYSHDRGQRSAKISFNVGQGSQDIGFRNEMRVLFDIQPSRGVTLRVKDESGNPAIASFVVKDRAGRLYPNPTKRLAPDFPFQPQVYRADGESIRLPAGYYTMRYSAGPEYFTRTKELNIDEDGPRDLSFQLQRWIDPSKYGWWSGDHHIHAAGCSHYKNPTEGVNPEDMIRQVLGESLNIGAVLTWGPSWYHQKQFFKAVDDAVSKPERLLHYDVEVSGFPSSHAGHLVLMGLKEDDYPGTTRIEEWPSWDLPVLRWAKSQGGVVGFSHSGWGLGSAAVSEKLPSYEMPGFDSIGANEYIVDVTHDAVDFISAVDTPYVWELSIWYHTLNVGFRTRLSGETDFPCIYDDKVGLGRSYVKLDKLTYRGWIEGIREGKAYVSDGLSHLIDLKVNGVEVGHESGEVLLESGQNAHLEVKAAAFLDLLPDPKFHNLPYYEKPYWNLERARIKGTRKVPVEVVVNGEMVASRELLADGQIHDLEFDIKMLKSSWIAVRILPSSHTNPIFALVDGRPIRASRRSAEWCLAAVDQCWSQKAPNIRERERDEARRAYDHARETYRKRLAESY